MRTFATQSDVAGSSRALAWDRMRPTSSCGTRLSTSAIGHTGFTGTSLWIDREKDRYIVLLSNRVHPTRQNQKFVALRPRIHDAVDEDMGHGT
jgi:CubicO group peptidase (beta-lactamase class C family)